MTLISSTGWVLSAVFFVIANGVAQGGNEMLKTAVLGVWTISRMMALLWWPYVIESLISAAFPLTVG